MLSESDHGRRNDLKRRRINIDWEGLRERSLQPGGFGRERVDTWTRLLNVTPSQGQGDQDFPPPDTHPHHDERQIGLDTDRSFVLYPVDSEYGKEDLQANLRNLLVSLFRKRPRMNYFQGYHDIATVLFLTMPEELQLPSIEKLSLHRLRDSMGAGLEPVLGLLRVTKNLIRLRDRAYADVLERNSPLPFYALSNLLTLFSHDVPTLPLIQHIFDYLLCRPPITIVYLATTIILSRKQDVLRMEEAGDDGMVHSLLSSLPNLSDWDVGESIDSEPLVPASDVAERHLPWKPDPERMAPKLECTISLPVPEKDQTMEIWPTQETKQEESASMPPETTEALDTDDASLDNSIQLTEKDGLAPSYDSLATSENDMVPAAVSHSFTSDMHNTNATFLDDCTGESGVSAVHPPLLHPDLPQVKQEGKDDWNHLRPQGTTLLTNLLREADALYAEFPPSHLDLHLSSIMGPQSVVFTWSESFSELPSDEEAEAMVQHPNLIVYPYVDMEEETSESSEYDGEPKPRKDRLGAKFKKDHPKKARTIKRAAYPHMEKGTIVAGVVLVVGVAVAVYGIKTRSGNGLFLSFANTQGHVSAQTRDLRRVGGWMSAALTTMGEKVVHAFDSLTIGNK